MGECASMACISLLTEKLILNATVLFDSCLSLKFNHLSQFESVKKRVLGHVGLVCHCHVIPNKLIA